MKTTVSEKVSLENEIFWREHTESLIKQGHFLCLPILEKSDMIWKSYMFNLKKGTLKFLLNSCLDTQMRENLYQNFVYRQVLKCKPYLERYTWRHNTLIKYITGLIDIDWFLMHADIPSYTLPGGGIVPPFPCDRT